MLSFTYFLVFAFLLIAVVNLAASASYRSKIAEWLDAKELTLIESRAVRGYRVSPFRGLAAAAPIYRIEVQTEDGSRRCGWVALRTRLRNRRVVQEIDVIWEDEVSPISPGSDQGN